MPRPLTAYLTVALLAAGAGCAGARPTLPDRGDQAAASARDGAETADPEALAVGILSERLSRPGQEIEVVKIQAVDWRDSSLGCPKPGRDYRQVITPGHHAVLRHGGKTWQVHMANGNGFVCERTARDAGIDKPVPRLALPVEHLQTLARSDLARRLGAPVEQIELETAVAGVWPDLSLGCPEAERTYEPAETKGHIFVFSFRGRRFEYHADLYRVVPCPAIESQ